jgi:hypothetical protein
MPDSLHFPRQQEIRTFSLYLKLVEHSIELGDQISPNETETNTLFQIGMTSCSLPLNFPNPVFLRIHFSPMV